HGVLYVLGAFVALFVYDSLRASIGIPSFHSNFWAALIVAPLVVGVFGMFMERFMLLRLYKFDHVYGLLLTFGIALVLQGVFTNYFNVSGTPYPGKPEV